MPISEELNIALKQVGSFFTVAGQQFCLKTTATSYLRQLQYLKPVSEDEFGKLYKILGSVILRVIDPITDQPILIWNDFGDIEPKTAKEAVEALFGPQ